ncbi:MAG: malic enzyme-like NAD(P)-binding protein [Phycisphaerae bacterium]|jgi:malate dehydrogenase (oxaloacetate-decarboxylating)
MKISDISWQERYRAPFIYTLRCKINDKVGALASLMTAISATNTHVGDIAVVSVDETAKIRDIQVFCTGEKHLDDVVAAVKKVRGIELIDVCDEVLKIHSRGMIETRSRVRIDSVTALRLVYTPGVAAMCHRIVQDPAQARHITGICDRVAIVTNGTAVLGLGDIGTLASLPVMEGKAAIFAEFAGISAEPVLVNSKDVGTVVETVARIAESFGAIQLEDIAAPACFAIEEQLQERLNIPVFHDDQHGTATVLLAALINALKMTSRKAANCSALILGAGAAGYAITMILRYFGIGDIVVYDSAGPIYRGRASHMNPYKQKLAELTNKENVKDALAEGFRGKDIFIGVAQPNMVTSAMIASMARNPLVFPLSNPVGEISVDDALKAGAAVAADGRTINNALAYPGLFRGALDAIAEDITFEMQLAASYKLAELASSGSLLPNMLDKNVHRQVAQVTAEAWKKK